MNSQVDGPPLGGSRLFLVAQQFIVGAAEVVAGRAVADSPASTSVYVILDDKLLRIAAFFAAASHVALQRAMHSILTSKSVRNVGPH